MSGPSIRKLYYSTAELCEQLDVRPYDLKKWERLFQKIRPSVSKTGRRLYKVHDITLIQKIKEMSELGYPAEEIDAALNHRQQDENERHFAKNPVMTGIIKEMLDELQSILQILR